MAQTLRYDVIEANFYGAMLADAYGLDVLDLHFHFRFSLQHRMNDGVHWNAVAHRYITCLLLAHSAQAWGVELPNPLAPGKLNKTLGHSCDSFHVPIETRIIYLLKCLLYNLNSKKSLDSMEKNKQTQKSHYIENTLFDFLLCELNLFF